MENNKLIAEFMGYTPYEKFGDNAEYYYRGEYVKLDEMRFHTSWDWLMPVVVKCFNEDDSNDDLNFRLNDALLETNIDSLYEAVVEFINEHNKYICGSCGDHVNEVVFNEDTDVDECTNCIH